MSKGIVLLAFGNPVYGLMAVNMAYSIRHFDKDVPIVLLHDDTGVSKIKSDLYLFTTRIKLEETDIKNPARTKTQIYKYLPFEHNLYLDVDGCALQSCMPVLEKCIAGDDYYSTYIVEKYTADAPDELPNMIWAFKSDIWNKYRLNDSSVLPATQSSIQYIRKCEQAEAFFNKLQENINNPIPTEDLRYQWGGSQPDELYLNITMAQMGICPHIGDKAMFFSGIGGNKALNEIEKEYNFLSIYGGKGFTKAVYIAFYDRVMANYYRSEGRTFARKSHYLYNGKHSDKRGIINKRNTKPQTAVNKNIVKPVQRQISLAITHYNRVDLLAKSFEKVINDERISEVVIVDDKSKPSEYTKLLQLCAGKEKIKLFVNEQNLGMSRNKAEAIKLCSNDWVIILDSDNIIDTNYIDKIYSIDKWQDRTIYAPEFAAPNFNYKEYGGLTFSRNNISELIDKPLVDCLFNTCNYFVNKHEYAAVFQPNETIKESDTIYFNYLWLKHGNEIFVVQGMEYQHLVHKNSGFMQNAEYNFKKADETKTLLRKLKPYKPKVKPTLMGRLGNQLFQIATAYAYAKDNNLELHIPNVSHDPKEWPTYFTFDTDDFQEERVYKEKHHNFMPIPKRENVRLEGYFQSEKYFKKYRNEILKLFGFNDIKVNEGVCAIHVRRGDYVGLQDYFPVLPLEYYLQAIVHHETQGRKYKYILFSDDIEWCKQNFIGEYYQFCEETDPLKSLRIMASCEHFIIANSSFSWWGAWASNNPNKKVIAPNYKQWFGKQNRHLNTMDVIPKEWMQLKYETLIQTI